MCSNADRGKMMQFELTFRSMKVLLRLNRNVCLTDIEKEMFVYILKLSVRMASKHDVTVGINAISWKLSDIDLLLNCDIRNFVIK